MIMSIAKAVSPTPEPPAPEERRWFFVSWGLLLLVSFFVVYLGRVGAIRTECSLLAVCVIARGARVMLAALRPEDALRRLREGQGQAANDRPKGKRRAHR